MAKTGSKTRVRVRREGPMDRDRTGTPSLGTRERIGCASAQCPECWESQQGTVTTDGIVGGQIPGGLRFTGVPCDKCGNTFTIEMWEAKP